MLGFNPLSPKDTVFVLASTWRTLRLVCQRNVVCVFGNLMNSILQLVPQSKFCSEAQGTVERQLRGQWAADSLCLVCHIKETDIILGSWGLCRV